MEDFLLPSRLSTILETYLECRKFLKMELDPIFFGLTLMMSLSVLRTAREEQAFYSEQY